MKTFFLLLSLTSALSVLADPGTVQSPVNYTCSPEKSLILGTDGTRKSCWPYICSTALDSEGHPMCKTHCTTSDDCQTGTSCDASDHFCKSAI